MGAEHAPDTVWRAESLYCVDRLSFSLVARRVGVADSTVRRWADTFGWREKREEIARAEAAIRTNTVKARARLLETLLCTDKAGDAAQMAYAATAFERLEIEKQKILQKQEAAALEKTAAASGMQHEKGAPPDLPSLPDGLSDAERLALLGEAVSRQIEFMLLTPTPDFSRRTKDIKAALEALAVLRPKESDSNTITVEFEE